MSESPMTFFAELIRLRSKSPTNYLLKITVFHAIKCKAHISVIVGEVHKADIQTARNSALIHFAIGQDRNPTLDLHLARSD